jgi:hypothetical protein
MKDYELLIEVLEEKVAPIGLSQGGMFSVGPGGG